MRTVSLKILPKQKQFLQSRTRGTIFEAGTGSGKSLVLCRKAVLTALNRQKYCIVSFSYRMLSDVILTTLKQDLPNFGLVEGIDYTINKSDMIINIMGTELLLRSGENPDSLRGLNLHRFGIDEAREFKDKAIFDILLGRIRLSEDAGWDITTTTKGKNWVYQLGKGGDPNITRIKQTTYENTFLPKTYIQELESRYTNDFRRQELLADIIEIGSGIIKKVWFNKIPYVEPVGGVRYWDLAVSTKTSADFSAGTRATYGQTGKGRFCIHNIIHGRFEYPDLRRKIIETAKTDGPNCVIGVEEAGQQKGFIDDLKRCDELAQYNVRALRPKGDKLNRLMPWAARAETGRVDICEGHWNDTFLDECQDMTPDDSHEHDDMVDSVSGAYTMISYTDEAIAVRMAY